MKVKQWLALVLAMLTVISVGPVSVGAEDTEANGFGAVITDPTVTLQQDSLTLTYEIATDRLTLSDTQSGSVWTNIPQGAESDEEAQGSIRRELESSVIVQYIDSKNNNFTANSSTSSVSRQSNTAYMENGDLIVDYDFSRNKEQFAIPVRYSIRDGAFTAEILFEGIREYGNMRICEIQLLPYFGAGHKGESGFLFVPDGSGAIVDFQDDRGWASVYSKQVYGGDPAQSDYVYSTSSEQIYLPVYGIQKGTQAFLAVLEQGDTNAFIEATQAGYNSSYASVAPLFSYRLLDDTTLVDKYGTEKTVTFESRRTLRENPKVRFLLAPAEQADLAGMAALYRDYMMKTQGMTRLTDKSASLFLDIYGVSQQKESFLGFLMNRSVTATTAQELRDITEALQQEGVSDGVLSLYYFNRSGTGSSVIKGFSPDSTVGSKRELTEAIQDCRENGYTLLWGVNNIRVASTSWGYWKFNAAAVNMLQTTLVEYLYKKSIRSIDKKQELYFYLRPDRLKSTLSEKGIDAILNAGMDGVVLQEAGSILYSDNKESHYSDRAQTQAYYAAWFEHVRGQESELLIDGANAYALSAADYVTHLPLATADFDICTKAVPFYSMVFHGIRSLASAPLNETEDSRIPFLQCILTGTGMTYNLTGKSPVVLRNTRLNTLLSSDYRDWVEEIGDYTGEYKAVQEALFDRFIVDYAWEGNVEQVVYDDGTVIAINSGDTSAVFDGREIPARDYIVYKR